MYFIPARSKSRIFTIEINRTMFDRRTVDFQYDMPEALSDLFRDLKGVMPFSYVAPYSHHIADMIDKFIHNRHTGFMRKVFQEGKILEILAAFLEQFTDDLESGDKKTVLRSD